MFIYAFSDNNPLIDIFETTQLLLVEKRDNLMVFESENSGKQRYT